MKILNTLVVGILLTNVGAMAMTAKVKDETKVVYEVLEGDSKTVQGKPSLAVDVKYKSEHVDIGVSADVNMTITTGLSNGTLKVNLRPMKENSTDLGEENLEFNLVSGGNSFPINLQLSSEENGIHYINLTLTVDGQGSKVIVIPVNVGVISKKLESKAVERTSTGAVISVSAGEEEVK